MGDGILPDGLVSNRNFPINTQPEILHKMEETFNNFMERNKEMVKEDNINHPKHYTDGKIEVIDFIEDKKLGFHLGNVVKYVSRSGKKDPSKTVEDLKKARWYLDRKIEKLEERVAVVNDDLFELRPSVIDYKKYMLFDNVPDGNSTICHVKGDNCFYIQDKVNNINTLSGIFYNYQPLGSNFIILNNFGYQQIINDERFLELRSYIKNGSDILSDYHEYSKNKSED